MSEDSPVLTDCLLQTIHDFPVVRRIAAPVAGTPGADCALLGFDHELRCRYATGPALPRLGIEPRLFEVDLHELIPALHLPLGGLCRCVFAGAYARTSIDMDGQRYTLSGLPLTDSHGAVSIALVRIVIRAVTANAPATGADDARAGPPAPAVPAARTGRGAPPDLARVAGF